MKRAITILVIIIVLAGVGGAAFLRFGSQGARAAAPTSGQMTTVSLGSLAATVAGAGNITSHAAVNLSFGTSGVVTKLNVNQGDRVIAGQVLAQLDTSNLELQLQNAQVNLKVAQDKLAQAQNPNSAQDIATARSQVDAAQANYNTLVAGVSPADLAAAQAAVASAQAAYNAAVQSAGTSNSQLEAAAAAVEKAQVALQQAQSAYDKVASNPQIAMLAQSVTLQQATIDYNTAKANYDSLSATTGSSANSQVQAARSQVEQAQANLSKLKTQVTPNAITAAKATVDQAKNNLEKMLAGSDANTLDIAQNGVDQAEIAVKQAQLQLQQAEIVSPLDGIVTILNLTVGQNAASGGSTVQVQVADLAHLEVVVNMAEVDIPTLKVGQPVQITLDALPNLALKGSVIGMSPAGTITQGVVNYPVTVSIDNPPDTVKAGMTASLNVITQQKDNVLLVPNRAVRTQGRQKIVTVVFEGQQIQVPVTTGMNNDTNTEVTSGLKEGDTVLISGTTTTQPRGGGVAVPGLGGGGLGRGG
jgi:HlyD family secretion protein